MSSRWHQLPRDEEQEEEKEEREGEDYEEEEEAEDEDDGVEDGKGGSAEDDAEVLTPEHHIDIAGRDDSFWDDDDDENESGENGGPRRRGFPVPPRLEDHAIIDVLAEELRQREIPSYLDQFEVVVPDAELVVGTVPLAAVQRREQEIEEAKIRQQQLEAELFGQREARLAQREVEIKEELKRDAEKKRQQLAQQKLQLAQTMELRTRQLGYVFQQAESHLKGVLERQQARVSEVFGQLEPSRVPAERRKYRVEWSHIPVTLKVRIKLMRALKDKLPPGQYVLLATLYDRLGGHALHWTAWDPEEKLQTKRRKRPRPTGTPLVQPQTDSENEPATTRRFDRPHVTKPIRHRGRFFNTTVAVNQNVFVVCPPQSQLRPANVLVFELFLLEGSRRKKPGGDAAHHVEDQIVAWGALPLMTPDFAYVDGKYKIPLLRGEMDATMDKFRDIEDMYTQDLSAWLCNLYVHVTPMKSEMERLIFARQDGDEQRYDIEIDQRNAVYRLRGSGKTEHDDRLRIRRKSHVREEEPLTSAKSSAVLNGLSTSTTQLTEVSEEGESPQGGPRGVLGFFARSPKRKKSNRVYAGSVVAPQLDGVKEENEMAESTPDAAKHELLTRNDSTRASLLESSQKQLERDDDDARGDEENDDDKILDEVDLENYHFSVNSSVARETAQHRRFHTARKLQFLRHELLMDLGFSRHDLHKLEMWLILLSLALALWLRVYVHYVAQWLFLKAQRVPVFFFRPQWTTCVIKYTWRTVSTSTEIGVITMGVLGNWLLFAFLALSAAISQAYVGELPAFGSKFLVCVGLATVVDPFLVFLVDVVHHQYDCSSRSDCVSPTGISLLSSEACKCVEGDAFKLSTRFLALEGSGLVGILLTVVLYAALTCLSLVGLYMYLLHVHMNGRMLDAYRRIHAQENDLFIPHDCELSLDELKAICVQATRWKGPRGAQRKVFVHDYVLQDPLDPHFQEKSTHIALYTITMDGESTRQLHRHFLKSHDGAIIELFGQVGANTDGSWQRDAAPGVVASLALLYNILQEHPRGGGGASAMLEATGSDLQALFGGEEVTPA